MYPQYTRFSLIFTTRRALGTTPLEGLDWGQSISSVGGRAEGARSNFSFEAHILFFLAHSYYIPRTETDYIDT